MRPKFCFQSLGEIIRPKTRKGGRSLESEEELFLEILMKSLFYDTIIIFFYNKTKKLWVENKF